MNIWDTFIIALGAFGAGAGLVALAADRIVAATNKARLDFALKTQNNMRDMLAAFDELRSIHTAQSLAYEACARDKELLRKALKLCVEFPLQPSFREKAAELLALMP